MNKILSDSWENVKRQITKDQVLTILDDNDQPIAVAIHPELFDHIREVLSLVDCFTQTTGEVIKKIKMPTPKELDLPPATISTQPVLKRNLN